MTWSGKARVDSVQGSRPVNLILSMPVDEEEISSSIELGVNSIELKMALDLDETDIEVGDFMQVTGWVHPKPVSSPKSLVEGDRVAEATGLS